MGRTPLWPELRLRTSLLLLLVLATTLTFAVVGGGILWLRLPQVEARAHEALQERARFAARLLEHDLRGVELQLSPIAALLARPDAGDAQPLLEALVHAAGPFTTVFLLDGDGRVQALAQRHAAMGSITELRGADFSAVPLYRALRGAAAPVWSDIYLSAVAGRNTVALGWRIGARALVAELDLGRMLEGMIAAARSPEAELLVLDGRGQWLASTRASARPTERYQNYSGLGVLQALQSPLQAAPQAPHKEMLFGERVLLAAARPAQLSWSVLASGPQGWGIAAYRSTTLLVLGGFGASLLVMLLLAPFWAARFARPVRALIEQAHAVARGQYDKPWPPQGAIVELNQLGADLAAMVQTIQQHSAQLRATLDGAPSVAIQWYSLDGEVLYWNQASELMYGYSAAQALGTRLRQCPLMYKDEAQVAELLAVLEQVVQRGESFGPAEFELRRADGAPVTVLATMFALPGTLQRPVIVCMDVDVTARKKAEATLRASERKLDAVFNASPAPMSVSDAGEGFRVITVNKAWEQQFRRRREDVLGLNGAEMGLWVDTQDRQRFIAAMDAGTEVRDMEAWLRTGDGRELLCRVEALRTDIDGQQLSLMMAVDITEQRRNEQQVRQLNTSLERRVHERTEALSQANEELQTTVEYLKATQDQLVRAEKLAALGRLVAGVAHELNTPLGNGLMAVSTLRERSAAIAVELQQGLRRSSLEAYLRHVEQGSEIAERNLQRAAELIGNFKQVAVDQTSARRRSFRLGEIIGEVLLLISPTTSQTRLRLSTRLALDPELDSYPGALVQVLSNLIVNAVIHAFEPGADGVIEVAAEAAEPGWVRLLVSDNGCGIDAASLGQIFDPFYTTRMGRGGTGLGLHLVHELVGNVLGGRIGADSCLGKGSRFVLELPLQAPVAAGARPP